MSTSRFSGYWATAVILMIGVSPARLTAQGTYVLPTLSISTDRVANETPAATFAMPVSALQFEPRVDVQARNFAEAQADVAIRGGIFENTGFKLGALALFDPQTGHYFDDTRRYIDSLSVSAEAKRQIFELNARRVYPRLDAQLKARGL